MTNMGEDSVHSTFTTREDGNCYYHLHCGIFASLQQEFAAQCQDQAEAEHPKSVRDKFPQLVPLLCCICEVTTKGQLPELWPVIANSLKKEAVTAMQAWMDGRTVQPGVSGISPILSQEISEAVASGKIVSQDLDNLLGGLSIFMIPKTYGLATIETRAMLWPTSYCTWAEEHHLYKMLLHLRQVHQVYR
jgi:hypothetical protein